MDDVRGDFLRPPHGTTPAAVSAFLRSAKNCRTAIVHDKQELSQHHKKCWHTSQTS